MTPDSVSRLDLFYRCGAARFPSSATLADAYLGFEDSTYPIDVARREPPSLGLAATSDSG